MCGIAGYVGTQKISQDRVRTCLSRMNRRGPDGTGTYRHAHPSGRHTVLLHSRLSIIDLDDRAAQPMRHGSALLTYNGELYNYLEIKKALEARGEAFTTTSDTEVLLRQLRLLGVDGLDGCEGMWAFALYDEAGGSLLLCRDRFGEKPLFIHRADHGLFFGSEVKFLSALVGRPFRPNLFQLRRYLVNGYRSLHKGKDTYFQEVEALPAGTILRADQPDGVPHSYWTPVMTEEPDMTFDQAVAGARDHLIRSMEIRLRSDVPLAFCQSGGVDSSSLLSIARRMFDYDVHGFTVVNKDERYDEWDIVSQTIQELETKHTSIPVDTTDFLPNLREVVRYHDAPLCTITYYAHWLLIRSVAAQGYKVSISGTGADELFTGYYDHQSMYLAEMHGTKRFDSALAEWNQHIRPIVRNPLLQDPLAFVNNSGQRGHIYLDCDKFSDMLTVPFKEEFREERYRDGLLRNRMLNELFKETIPPPLYEDDLNSMFFSVENRSPYLDRHLFDFCSTIPTRHLIQNGFNKAVLRKAMEGITPDCVLSTRRKVGFNAPLFDFLDVASPEVRSQLVQDSPVFDILDRDKIKAMLQPSRLSNSNSKFLFSFVSTKLFLEEFGNA